MSPGSLIKKGCPCGQPWFVFQNVFGLSASHGPDCPHAYIVLNPKEKDKNKQANQDNNKQSAKIHVILFPKNVRANTKADFTKGNKVLTNVCLSFG